MIKSLDLYDISLIIANTFSVYIVKRFLSVFLKEKKNRIINLSAYLFFWLISTFSCLIIDIPLINLLASVIGLFCVVFTYNTNMSRRLLLVAFSYGLLFITELFFSAMTGRIEIAPLSKGEYSNIFGLFLCKMGTFLIVLLIENGSYYMGKKSPPFTFLIATIFIPTSSIFICGMIISIHGVTSAMIMTTIIILVLINVITFTLYDTISVYYEKQLEASELKQENIYYHNQFMLMKESVEETRKFRHDIYNHLSIINGFLKVNNIKEAKNYLSELNAKEQELEENILETGNPVVDSILNYKLSILKNNGIMPECEVFIPKELNLETVHFVSILTNLLDNATEALQNCSENNKKIFKLHIAYTKGCVMILIKNSYTGDILYENGNIVSSKKDSDKHGLGLQNVKKAVNFYNGLIKTEHLNGIFSVRVLLYVD